MIASQLDFHNTGHVLQCKLTEIQGIFIVR